MDDTQIAELFSLQRDVTVGVRDGVLIFINGAGQGRYPHLRVGAAASTLLPEAILSMEEASFSSNAEIGAECCTVIGAQVQDMRVYTILPQTHRQGEGAALLENVCGSMRRTLTVLNMATKQLIPAINALEEGEQRANLTVLNKSYYQLERLCDHVDQFFRLQDGRERLYAESTELVQFCRDLTQSVAHFVTDIGASLHFKTDVEHLVTVIDRQKATKLLLNLISNSIGGLDVTGDVTVELTRKGDNAIIAVRDTGPGIPSEDMPHIFEQYKKEKRGTDIWAGVGFGMAIAGAIARLHGGTLRLSSKEDQGTTVLVKLPIRRTGGDGQLTEAATRYGDGDGGIHTILMELSQILDHGAFGDLYMD